MSYHANIIVIIRRYTQGQEVEIVWVKPLKLTIKCGIIDTSNLSSEKEVHIERRENDGVC